MLYRMNARTPITAAAAETIPPDRRAASPVNMTPWEGVADADAQALFMGSAPLGIALDAMAEEGEATGTSTGIME
jgi:hypothetical protein